MAIKTFGGLGQVDVPTATGGKGTVTTNRDVKTDNLHTSLQLPPGKILRGEEPIRQIRPEVDIGIKPRVFSQESGLAPFETLFDDFRLEARPVYNFWTPDELTNDRDERGNRKLDDIPRYITLTWSTAPDLQDPADRIRAKDVRARDIRPVIFSREIERKNVFNVKGMGFTPEHLQLDGFAKIKAMIADGHMAPGVIEGVVDIAVKSTGVHPQKTLTNLVDEDAFLTNPDYTGLSIHEMIAQVNQVSDGIASMANASEGVGEDVRKRKEELVDGKFTMSKSMTPGGKMGVSSVHPSSPSLGFSSRTAVPARQSTPDVTSELVSGVTGGQALNQQQTAQVKVKFFNPAIGGLIDRKKINLMSAPEHVESLSAIAPALPDLEIISRTNIYDRRRSIDIPSIPSPRMKPLEYVGYVIEKYRRQASGVFVKVDEIDVPSRQADTFYDTKVLYGEVYRYRIKTIIRWNRHSSVSVEGSDPTVSNVFASQTSPLASYKSSFFSSEWCKLWAYGSCIDDQPPAPPDELTVRSESHKKRVVVTFRLPENPQKDIWKMRLLRKFKDEIGRDISDWMTVVDDTSDGQALDFAPKNVIYFDTDIDFFQKSKTRVVYAAQCISRHGEASFLSEQLCARLNADYFSKGEFPVEFVSSAGVRKEYFGAFSTNPVRTTSTEIVVSPRQSRVASLSFSGRDVVGNASLDSSKYVCRIQSLDTGETTDVPFDVTFSNVPSRQEVAEYDFYVPKDPVPAKEKKQRRSKEEDGVKKQKDDWKNEVKVKDRPGRHERW